MNKECIVEATFFNSCLYIDRLLVLVIWKLCMLRRVLSHRYHNNHMISLIVAETPRGFLILDSLVAKG
jgi:hypothetical protein